MTDLKPVFTVSELNEYVDLMLSHDPYMGELTVTGEISAFKRHTSGHLYFTLKDDAASVRCVMFRPNALRLSFFPKDGMSVRIEGRAGLFGRDGAFQVYAERMEKTGDGALYQKFLALREELRRRGWFDEAGKKPIPFLPRAVGVVTSGTGAAIEDIRNVVARRFPNMPIVLYPVAVQGEKAAGEIAAAIRQADRERRCDVLIVGRGGGSLEDLWAFNEEVVVAAVHDCGLPVISAVGHEIDFSLTDFAADLRAPTPSAAAELAVPELGKLMDRLSQSRDRLRSALLHGVERKKDRLELLIRRRGGLAAEQRLQQTQQRLDQCRDALEEGIEKHLRRQRDRLAATQVQLKAADPLGALDRGFALVYDGKNDIIRRAEETDVGEGLTLRFRDGRVRANVTGKDMYEKE
ncbi:MAG: exodeoxyribonuclease VII large subunit [Clostridia bacterium]|nr:exodeoxyribonuclease VII large subunit [Clostridia bacterium]